MSIYNDLLKNGWRMTEIDGMDVLGFMRVRAWEISRDSREKAPQHRFIDEVWPGSK